MTAAAPGRGPGFQRPDDHWPGFQQPDDHWPGFQQPGDHWPGDHWPGRHGRPARRPVSDDRGETR